MRILKVGDLVQHGDVLLTTQDGIVQIAPDPQAPTRSAAKPAAPVDDIDRVIAGLDHGEADVAPAAGLNGGGGGSLEEGLRVERIGEAIGAADALASAEVLPARSIETTSTSAALAEPTPAPTVPLQAGSSSIRATEEGAPTSLGLAAPTGAGASATVTVTQVPALGEIHRADGGLVTAGTALTAAELTGLVYMPPQDYDGTAPAGGFAYTVTSGAQSASGTTTIDLAAVNDAPTAQAAIVAGAEDAVLPVALGGSDVDGSIASVTVVSIPAGSTLLLADGVTAVAAGQSLTAAQAASLLFRPAPDYNGRAGIVFTVTDDGGLVAPPATLHLVVEAVNDAPVGTADLASTPINTPLGGIVVLANDSDVDGDTLHVSAAALVDPSQGSVSINPDGTLSFTPALNVSGPVQVQYTVTDPSGAGSTAVLTVNVGNNTPPTGSDTTITLAEDGSHAFSAADFGFADGDSGQTLAAVRIDALPAAGSLGFAGQPVSVGQMIPAAALGSLVFTPAPDANGIGYAPFSFSVQDSAGDFDGAPNTVTFDVTPVADAALIGGQAMGATVEDGTLIASGTLSVVDPDAGEQAFVPQTQTAGTHGSLSIDAAGHWTYTLDNTAPGVQSLGATDSLRETFTVATLDGTTRDVVVTINGSNDAPVAAAAAFAVAEDAAVVHGSVSASDVDAGAALGYALVGAAPAGLSFAADGTYSFDPAHPAYQSLAQGQTLVLTVPFQATDERGAASGAANLSITLTGINDAAVVTGVATGSVTEDGTPLAKGQLQVSDVDGPAAFTAASAVGTYGDFTIDVSGAWTYTLRNGDANVQALTSVQHPAESFTVTAADGTMSTVTVTVNGANEAPTAAVTPASGAEDAIGIPVTLAGADADGTIAGFTVSTLPAHGTLMFNGAAVGVGSFVPATAGSAALSFVPDGDWSGSTSLTFAATDAEGAVSAAVSQSIGVSAVNDAPVGTADLASTPINTPLGGIVVLANDSDVDGDTLHVSTAALVDPSQGSVSINPDGTLSFTPALNVSGPVQVQYTVTDPSGAGSTAVLTVNVGNNTPPTGSDTTITLAEDGSHTFSAADFGFADGDSGQTLAAVRIDALPAAGSLGFAGQPVSVGQMIPAAALGSLVFTPAPDANGAGYASFGFSVQDSAGSFDASPNTITFDVTPVADSAVISGDDAGATVEDTTLTASGTLTVVDPDADEQAFVVQTNVAGAHGTFSVDAAGHWTYTLDNTDPAVQALGQGQSLPAESFSVSSIDGTTQTIAVTITGINDAAAITGVALGSVTEDGTVQTQGQLGVVDVDGAASFTPASAAGAYGDFSIDAAGLWTYTLRNGDANVQGLTSAQHPLESFTVSASDGTTATVTVTVNGVNEAPVASVTAASGAEDAPGIPVTLSAGDVDGSIASFTVATLPAHGSLLFNGAPVSVGDVIPAAAGSASLSFVPEANWNGSTSLSFAATDNEGRVSATVSQSITVTPVADAAVISGDDAGATVEDTTLTASGTLTVVDPDAGEQAFVVQTNVAGAHGTFSVDAAGHWTYTLDNTDPAVQALGQGQSLPAETFSVASIDGTIQTVTVSITGTADEPTITGLASGEVREDLTLSAIGTLGVVDPDAGQSSFVAQSGVAGTYGSFSITAAGVWTYTLDNAAAHVQALGASSSLTETFAVTTADGTSRDVVVTVRGSNDAPVAVAAAFAVAEDAPLVSGSVSASDADAGATLSYALTGAAPAGLNFNADGSYSFDPSNAAYQSLAAGQPLVLTVPFRATDDEGIASGVANLTITITGVNDAAVVTGVATGSVTEDGTLLASGTLSAADADGAATFTAASASGVYGDFAIDASGAWTYTLRNGDANVQALGSAQHPTETFAVSTADGTVRNITVTVNGANEAPSATVTPASGAEDAVGIPLTLGGSDVDGTVAGFTVTSLPAHGTLFFAGAPVTAGTLIPATAGSASLSFVPDAGWNGSTSLSFFVTDNEGVVSSTVAQSITVTPVNDAPVASSSTITVAEQSADTPLGLSAATDVDGNPLTITVTGLPTVGTLTLADGTAVVTGQTLTSAQLAGLQFDAPTDLLAATSTSFAYTVSDGTVTVNAGTTINVTPVNDAPVASSSTITVAEQSADTPLGLVAPSDVDGNPLTITVTGLPSVGTVTLADGTAVSSGQDLTAAQLAGLQFDAPADLLSATSTSFAYTVSDGTVTVNAGTTINVTPVNDAPVASSSTITLSEQSADTPLGLVAPSDVDGNPLTITVTGLPSVGTVTLADGTAVSSGQDLTAAQLAGLQFDAPADLLAATSTTFAYTVSDGTVTVNAGTTINVTPVNDAPVASSSTITVSEQSADTPLGLVAPSDVDGNPLTITVTGLPSVGTVTLADGTAVSSGQDLTAAQLAGLQFDAPADLLAATSTTFAYTVSDGTVTVNAGTTINITPVNDAPVANPDAGSLLENATLVAPALIGALFNDTDVDSGDSKTVSGVAFGGTAGTVGSPLAGTYGTLTLDADGRVVYAANRPAAEALAAGQVVVEQFTYTMRDGSGATSSSTITFTITGRNDAPTVVADTRTTTEDAAVAGNVLGNDSDLEGSTLSLTQFSFGGTTVAAGASTAIAGVGTLTMAANGDYTFTPAANYAGAVPAASYVVSDGSATSSSTLSLSITPVADTPTLVVNGSSTTGGTTTPPTVPPSVGLTLQYYDNIAAVGTSNASTIANVEAGVESSTATSTGIATDVAIANIAVDDAYRFTGYVHLTAGTTYTIGGYRDDTLMVKIGGTSVYAVGYNNWGTLTGTAFTPAVSGYYSLEVVAYNGDGIGSLDLTMAVGNAAAVDLNTSNFRLYPDTSAFSSSGTVVGPMVGNGDGGYYPTSVVGNEDTTIPLGTIAASLTDTDGSESLALRIGSIPVGATLGDGSHSFTATAGATSVDVTGWALGSLTLTPPPNVAGSFALDVIATATDSNGSTAVSQTTLPVNVVATADMPSLAGATTLISMVQGSGATATLNLPVLATLADRDGSESLTVTIAGVPSGATLNHGSSNGAGTWTVSGADLADLTLTLPAGHNGSTTLNVTAIATEASNGATASTTSSLTLVANYTSNNATVTGTSGDDDPLNGGGGNARNFIDGLAGNDTIDARGGDDLVRGGDGADHITGGAGNDVLFGDAGDDILIGGTGNDRLVGGAGNDTMTGSATPGTPDSTTDVFAWALADAGAPGAPPTDTITDFNASAASAGGDVLDLRDLLAGDALGAGNSAGNLANYLDFSVSTSGGVASTTIHISSSGAFANGNDSAAQEDQAIVLQGVNLPTALGLASNASDAQIIQELVNRGKLLVDSGT